MYLQTQIMLFQPPVIAKPWKEERQAVKDSEICIQRDPFRRDVEIEGSEDCLYLNVYTPQVNIMMLHIKVDKVKI